jgi:hypothetical protein
MRPPIDVTLRMRSPATASTALLRLTPVGDGAPVLAKHGPLVGDAVLVVPKPTTRAMNYSLMERDANRDRLGYVDKAGGQAAVDAVCAFVGRGWVLVSFVIDGHMVKVGNGAGLCFGESFTTPRFQELLRFGDGPLLSALVGIKRLDTAGANIGPRCVLGVTNSTSGAVGPILRRVPHLDCFTHPGVGLHSNPGISDFDLIFCTQIPEFKTLYVL